MRSSSCDPVSLRMTVSRGHGTYVDNDEAVASIAGTIERVNKLVFPCRYNPEVGDLGRITEVRVMLVSS